jgi:hypothetical protein
MPRRTVARWSTVDACGLGISLVKVAGAILYVIAFEYAYDAYLPRYWSAWGFALYEKSSAELIVAILVAAAPALWLPSRNDRPSTLFMWVIFLIVYVPTIIVSFKITPQLDGLTTQLWFYLLVGFFILTLVTRLAPISVERIVMPGAQSSVFIIGFGLALFALTVATYGASLNVLAFTDIYKQRASVNELAITGPAVYAYWWLSNALLPLGLVWALHHRKPLLFAACFIGQIIMFGVAASKLAGLIAFAGPLLYVFARMFRQAFGAVLVWVAAIVVAGAGALAGGGAGLVSLVVSFLLARTIGIPGLATVQYFKFFSTNDLTYWSHVNIIGLFVQYPYSKPLPYLFGNRLYSQDLLSWNANFWATDGIAALGAPGVLVISVFTGLTFRILDQACRHLDPRVTAAWALAPAMALANIGLFTAIATEGLGIMILAATILPKARPNVPLSRPMFGKPLLQLR